MSCHRFSFQGQKKIPLTRGQAGQILLYTLVTTMTLTIAIVFILNQILDVDKKLRYPRLKAQQTIQKARLQTALNQPFLYSCPVNSVSAVQVCSFNYLALANLLGSVKGAVCGNYAPQPNEVLPSPAGSCGFSVRMPTGGGPMFDPVNRKFNALLHYMGNETSVADTPIKIDIAGELLNGEIVLCPAATPQFKGFDAVGNAKCEAFPGPLTCGSGEFVETVNPTTFQVTCHNYVSGISCGQGEKVGSLSYGGGAYGGGCSKRANPFIYYDYNPENSFTGENAPVGVRSSYGFVLGMNSLYDVGGLPGGDRPPDNVSPCP